MIDMTVFNDAMVAKMKLDALIKDGLTSEHLEAYLKKQQEKTVDTRYNVPKEAPKASEELVDKTIASTEIYRRAKLAIMQAQRKQVGYGLDKYPEPLNANTWSTIETIDHIIEESIDKLHYLTMLRIKLEQDAATTQSMEAEKYKYLYESLKRETDSKGRTSMMESLRQGVSINTNDRVDELKQALEASDRLLEAGIDNDGDVRKVHTVCDQYDNKYIVKDGVFIRVE